MVHRILLSGIVLAVLTCAAAAHETPIVRYNTWMIVGPGLVEVQSKAYGTMHDDFIYRDQPIWRVLDTNGDLVQRIDARLGETSSFEVATDDLALLHLQPGRNYAVPAPGDAAGILPWAFVATEETPLPIVDGFGELYFWLPPGLTTGSVLCHAFSPGEAGRLIVSEPGGGILAELESDFLEPEVMMFRLDRTNPHGMILQLSLLEPENPEWVLDDATVWLGSELPGLLTPSLDTAALLPELARKLGIDIEYKPVLDFEGERSPIRTIQWSRAVPPDAQLPAHDVRLSDEEPFSGQQSLRIELRFPEGYEERWQEIKLFTAPIEIEGLRKVRFFMYGDGSGRTMRIRARDAFEEHHYVDGGIIDWTGWKAVVADFEHATASISGGDENKRIDGPHVTVVIHITHTAENPLHSILYIDDMAVQVED